jgi:2-hydroxychromene-2-carboxylate isomerase
LVLQELFVSASIEFFVEFSSPYSFLAARKIEVLGAKYNREIVWKPFLLGAVFKVSGGQPILSLPMKGDYADRDLKRVARRDGIELGLPDPFPFSSVAASRAFYAEAKYDVSSAKKLGLRLQEATFIERRAIGSIGAVLEIAGEAGLDTARLEAGMSNENVKEQLKTTTNAAIERGVFGAPFFFIDGEPFWGQDRMDDMDLWLGKDGW